MDDSRRRFLKLAGLSAVGLSSLPAFHALASSGGGESEFPREQMYKGEKALTAKRWGMVIDTRKLHSTADLRPMIEVCHKIHNVPEMENEDHEIKWLWSDSFGHVFPGKEHEHLAEKVHHLPFLVLCNHCESPACVRACPTKATFQRDDGIVLMDFHRCIGCRFCMAACPYGSRSFNFRDPRPFIKERNPLFPTRMRGVVEKCNFCAERLAEGKMPACVEVSKGALVFGDLDDPDSEIRKVLRENFTIRRKPSLGAGPSVFYIV